MGIIVLIFFPILENYNAIDNRIYQTCQFVQKRVVPTGADINEWLRQCRNKSRALYLQSPDLKKQLELGNDILSELKISHLELFNKEESEAIWTDTDLENGIESRFIDAELVVTRVHPNSEASKKGMQRGDRIALEKNESLSPYELNKWKGKLTIQRKDSIFRVELEPKVLSLRREISVMEVQGTKVVSVESFKSGYFSAKKMEQIKTKIKAKDKVIIDLRGNNGGNFVSGLRLLSAFFCKPTIVGYMKKNRDLGRVGFFENNLEDEYQIQTLSQFDSVVLKTFANKNCLPKPQAILIDAFSKSTAEWVALAFRDILNTPIYGATSAGELLVGIWYDVSNIWNTEIKLSIPEAFYESISGYQIEGKGVPVDTTLYPRRADFEQGFDSELLQIIKVLN